MANITVPVEDDKQIVQPPLWLRPSINVHSVVEAEKESSGITANEGDLKLIKLMDASAEQSIKKADYADQLTGAGLPAAAPLSEGLKELKLLKKRKRKKNPSVRKFALIRAGRVKKRAARPQRRRRQRKTKRGRKPRRKAGQRRLTKSKKPKKKSGSKKKKAVRKTSGKKKATSQKRLF